MEGITIVSTRSGRAVKAPERYVPIETPLDDFSETEAEECSDTESEGRAKKRRRCNHPDSDEESDDSDTGSDLKGFVVSDDEDYSDCSGADESEELLDSGDDTDEAE